MTLFIKLGLLLSIFVIQCDALGVWIAIVILNNWMMPLNNFHQDYLIPRPVPVVTQLLAKNSELRILFDNIYSYIQFHIRFKVIFSWHNSSFPPELIFPKFENYCLIIVFMYNYHILAVWYLCTNFCFTWRLMAIFNMRNQHMNYYDEDDNDLYPEERLAR